MARSLCTVPLVLSLLAAPAALAQEGEELVEKVVVRNRLYTMAGKLEVSPVLGLTILTRLTNHYNLNLGVALNFTETLAVEARGGWALSGLTGLARDLQDEMVRNDPGGDRPKFVVVDDLKDLWQLNGNLAVGVRWMPLYGKVNVLGDVPVHFQAYLWAGPGVGTFTRESIVFCHQVDTSSGARKCIDFRTDRRTGPLGSGAVGFRFFTHRGGALRVEVRDWVFPDSYLELINRVDVESGLVSGTPARAPGLTHLVMADVGYTFFF
ncbi:MAG: outer membrane beta-barrel domain-containing protein [Myxococcaceae bacterium]|nr:outer membrane beta-barrel domain-containing protein [Myxococcaceae bacterium]MCI0670011.1 outer membrane beta-barrel domain-containing protein [Myxococcaceae bacterium]